jgi:hypothetical protein
VGTLFSKEDGVSDNHFPILKESATIFMSIVASLTTEMRACRTSRLVKGHVLVNNNKQIYLLWMKI